MCKDKYINHVSYVSTFILLKDLVPEIQYDTNKG